jgi:hypothetical protein
MATDNLLIELLATNQDNKEVTINDGFSDLDAALTENTIVDISQAAYTFTQSQVVANAVIGVTNVGTGTPNITLPQTVRLYCFYNSDSSNGVSIVRGTTSIGVAANTMILIYTDGTANGLVAVGT